MGEFTDDLRELAELSSAVAWIERAPREVAKHLDAPEDLKHRLVEVMVTSNNRGVQVDVHLTINMHRSLACESGKNLVEAVKAVRASLRDKKLE